MATKSFPRLDTSMDTAKFLYINIDITFRFGCIKSHHWITIQGPLHTLDWEPVTITLQAPSLVEKAEPVQVHFTLHLRDQRSVWMQDGYKVYMHAFLHGIGWIVFHDHSNYIQKSPFGGRPNTQLGDHGTQCSQPLVYSILSYARNHMTKNSLK